MAPDCQVAGAEFYAALHSARAKVRDPAVRYCRAHTLGEHEMEIIEIALSFLERALRNASVYQATE